MGDVWDRTTAFLGERAGTVVPIALLAILLPGALSSIMSMTQLGATPAIGLLVGVVTIGLSLVQLWGQLAIAALAADPALGGGAMRVATARLLPTIGVYILVGLAAVILFLPIVGVAVASGVPIDQLRSGGAGATLPPGTSGTIAVITLMLLIVALFAAARLMVLLPVLAIERRGIGSVIRTVRLTRGLTWRLVGVLILYMVVTLVSVLAAQTVVGSIMRIVAGGGQGMTVASVTTALAVAAVTTAFTVIGDAFMGKLYVATIARAKAGEAA